MNSQARLRQLLARTRLPSSGKRCIQQGGVLKLHLRPPPRTIRCDISRGKENQMKHFNSFCLWKKNYYLFSITANLCKTKSGPSSNQPCIFPFTWKDEKYNGCPIDPVDSSQRWCSTKVDSNGNHITGQGNWGHCDSKCPEQNWYLRLHINVK